MWLILENVAFKYWARGLSTAEPQKQTDASTHYQAALEQGRPFTEGLGETEYLLFSQVKVKESSLCILSFFFQILQ